MSNEANSSMRCFAQAKTPTRSQDSFVARLRELASRWEALGISPSETRGIPVFTHGMVGIRLPHIAAPLNYLWASVFEDDNGMKFDGQRGDET